MVQGVTDVRALVLEQPEFGAEEAKQLQAALGGEATQYQTLRQVAGQLQERIQAAAGTEAKRLRLRLGIVEHLLGRNEAAIASLREAADHGVGEFYLGKALVARGQYQEASQSFQKAADSGSDPVAAKLQRAGALRAMGQHEEALRGVRQLEAQGRDTAEYHYQLGSCLAATGDRQATVEFEQALNLDPNHSGALFALAYANDLHGNDDEALSLYERCVRRLPVSVGALINLGTLYEDAGRYDRAAECFRRVLAAQPDHSRARLFLKDVLASRTMFYDEDAERRSDRFNQVLEIPVTDFELSVRSRNCLKKMNIRTLGDLTRTTEPQLLASKNFGETSLEEIKEVLAAKGLRLGQALEQTRTDELFTSPAELSAQEQALLAKPIAELNLSVRARKCMTKLGITTVGELLDRTGDELLECKNFGVTSLNEVRQKLTEHGLKLKGD